MSHRSAGLRRHAVALSGVTGLRDPVVLSRHLTGWRARHRASVLQARADRARDAGRPGVLVSAVRLDHRHRVVWAVNHDGNRRPVTMWAAR